jgi:DNA polymerase-4
MSRETTFERDMHPRQDRPALSVAFTGLCTRVADDLARKGYVGRTVGIKIRFADFKTVTRDVTLPVSTADAASIRHAATECLKRIVLDRRLRLIGVRVSALTVASNESHERVAIQQELPFSVEDVAGRRE